MGSNRSHVLCRGEAMARQRSSPLIISVRPNRILGISTRIDRNEFLSLYSESINYIRCVKEFEIIFKCNLR